MPIPEPALINQALGHVVASTRVRRGWTQGQLGARAGVSQNAISEIESARRGVHLHTFLRLAMALGIDPCLCLGLVLDRVGDTSGPLPRLGRQYPRDCADS